MSDSTTDYTYSGHSGGLGAEIGGDIFLEAGAVLEIMAGGEGGRGYAGGGGGGSYFNGTVATDAAGVNSGNGEVIVTLEQALCFLHGTRILTPTGEVPVEALGIGDAVVTRFGGIQKVRWIGRQSYDPCFLRHNRGNLPVRIRAGALGEGQPARDLLVSPGHSLLLGDVLVLAGTLVNGITITQAPGADNAAPVEYYQIDLGRHDCVIAEGAWAESFADGPDLRGQFPNAGEFFALYPDIPPAEELSLCAPRPERGTALEAVLRPVVAIASIGLTPGRLEGYIDRAGAWKVEGWAFDHGHPDLPVMLEIMLGEETLGTILACDTRADLAAAGKGSGRCAFSFTAPRHLLPEALSGLRVRRAADGAELAVSDARQASIADQPIINQTK